MSVGRRFSDFGDDGFDDDGDASFPTPNAGELEPSTSGQKLQDDVKPVQRRRQPKVTTATKRKRVVATYGGGPNQKKKTPTKSERDHAVHIEKVRPVISIDTYPVYHVQSPPPTETSMWRCPEYAIGCDGHVAFEGDYPDGMDAFGADVLPVQIDALNVINWGHRDGMTAVVLPVPEDSPTSLLRSPTVISRHRGLAGTDVAPNPLLAVDDSVRGTMACSRRGEVLEFAVEFDRVLRQTRAPFPFARLRGDRWAAKWTELHVVALTDVDETDAATRLEQKRTAGTERQSLEIDNTFPPEHKGRRTKVTTFWDGRLRDFLDVVDGLGVSMRVFAVVVMDPRIYGRDRASTRVATRLGLSPRNERGDARVEKAVRMYLDAPTPEAKAETVGELQLAILVAEELAAITPRRAKLPYGPTEALRAIGLGERDPSTQLCRLPESAERRLRDFLAVSALIWETVYARGDR